MLAFLLTLAVGNFCLPESRRLTSGMVGHDFLAFYTAGTFIREGRARDLYDLEKFKTFQHELGRREGLEIGASFGPFWNPPFYAWPFAPLSALPYHQALAVWEGLNALCAIAAIAILIHLLRGAGYTAGIWALTPILIVTSMPFIQAATHGQNTFTSLLLLCLVLLNWTRSRPLLAGIFAGALFYKPQLGAVIALALVVTSGWRALVGVAVTGSVFALVTLFTLPGVLQDYQQLLPHNLRVFQVEQPYLWDRHVTLRAFWRLLLQGRETGEMWPMTKALWIASCVGVVSLLGWGMTKAAREMEFARPRELWFGAIILAMPLLMPFYFDYDLLLIATAAVLTVRARPESARSLLAMWVVLFIWLLVNSTVGRLTHVNGTVLLLCGLLWMTLRRLPARRVEPDTETAFAAPPLAIATST